DRWLQEWNGAWVELAARQPKEAREIAAHMLGDPRVRVSTNGAMVTVASYLMEGRITDGESALWREFDRQRTTGSPLEAAGLVWLDLRLRRWLGRPPPDDDKLAFLDKTSETMGRVPGSTFVTEAMTELALARAGGRSGKANAAEALRAIEAAVDRESEGER